MNYSKLFIVAIVLLIAGTSFNSYADSQTKRVRNVVGRCEITRHITLEQAEQKALQEAKTNALRQAGVPEKLWTVTGLITQGDGSEFSQVLSKMTTLQVDGLINIRKVSYSEEVSGGKRYAVATIDAEVRRGGGVDPTFVLDINDVDGIYSDGSELKFKARIYGHDAYLHVFWFDSNGGSVIFPSDYEKKRLFIKETEYTFPLDGNIQYLMEKLDKDRKFETINIIVVATKRDIPFLEDTITFESLLKWIYAIPADERAAWREAVVIQ